VPDNGVDVALLMVTVTKAGSVLIHCTFGGSETVGLSWYVPSPRPSTST
jgi:hypothetical protein